MWEVLFDSQAGETNIRSGRCWGHGTNADHEMNSCLICIPFKLHTQLPADCQTCMNKAKSEAGIVMQTSCQMNLSHRCVSCLIPSSVLFHPACRCGLGETRWSSTGYSVCWGRRKRRRRTSSRPALLQQWVWRKWKQRYSTWCNVTNDAYSGFMPSVQLLLQHWNCIRKQQKSA